MDQAQQKAITAQNKIRAEIKAQGYEQPQAERMARILCPTPAQARAASGSQKKRKTS